MKIEDIAKQLKELGENIVLIYAFNATGKTRLSVAYKNATKNIENGQHTGVYYNAFSEDLFVWDNDENNDGANIRLNVLPSSLNRFHSFLYENPDAVMDKLAMYSPKFKFNLNSHDNPEDGIESVTFFSNDDDAVPIKISRGEERIFVWCFFLALLEVDGWANAQDAHIFIDDPVSSLDEHNIYVTAETIFQQIEQHYLKKKIIVTTHHIGLFSILADRLKKGEKSDRYKHLAKLFILKNLGGEYTLGTPRNSVFLFHLHLLQLLEEASKEQLYSHHVVMLRQALENIASFFGRGNIGYTLAQIGVEDYENAANVINSLSHKDAYYYQSDLMSPAVEAVFKDVFAKLLDKYKFALYVG
ncbi:TPA: AAA family ATPase [Pseudomonas aeruginosa]|uniref:AAA family ATPase n=1 Tax=Pseudomonas aeruginosa TaxID=287 RepID=UPI001906380F|nr:AAA family ATPase [Pseudomonas aeruginosa]MDI2459378.1 AAA family ATPase [Pseudomonas aeruginosa]HBO4310609.1 AAA family ATPase [Pseudomonas aeruginosa]HBO4703202.1 AAA family ATPase [Pseudomonas aeruginosa]HCF4396953.1 AAA family ATPase [Pseudomonas aeruginosa]HCF6227521.1 AAA family ATPase [Pseudomonas aeruginosa]